jgi:hypothetical protein
MPYMSGSMPRLVAIDLVEPVHTQAVGLESESLQKFAA